MRKPKSLTHDVSDVVERLHHAKQRIIQAVSWARAVNEVWRTFNRHASRQDVADSDASAAADIYERSTRDAQIMMVSRIFDKPGKRDVLEQNRISFTVCRRLLDLPGVMDQLQAECEEWNETGFDNRQRLIARHQAFIERLDMLDNEQPNRITLIRGFRDENIAHELRFDVLPARAQYDHIHGIVDEASILIGHLAFIVSGEAIHWQDEDVGRSATWMWESVAEAYRREL